MPLTGKGRDDSYAGDSMVAAANSPLMGRQERRLPTQVIVEITDWRQAAVSERTFTENVSVQGARISSRWHWSQDELVLIRLHSGEGQTLARTVYCEPLAGDVYAVGVQFLQPAVEWWKE